eukprot:gb/GECG01011516.1/.p1 GENE.gb/GECG01011516.1/~~gb/GECG01011516.1/.p1  ORF type:complete len:214 (+),score=56.13 gb/GECG01011516.1/:1-642(+)
MPADKDDKAAISGAAEGQEEDSDDDSPPELEEEDQQGQSGEEGGQAGGAGEGGRGKQNRAEKKSRKAMQKLGMKPIGGITRVTVKKSKNILFVIAQPEVFKSPVSDTYIIFGEAKIEDLSSSAQSQAAQAFQNPDLQSLGSNAPSNADQSQAAKTQSATHEAEEEDEEVDEEGLEPNDIELVMNQGGVSRSKAVKALRNNSNDVVNSIMELTE